MSKLYTRDDIQIFIFTKNNKERLHQALTSVLNQSIGELFITVLDIGSTDGTGDYVYEMSQKHPNVKYCWHEFTDEKVVFLKKAIEMTETDYVMMFQDKDLLHPDYVKFAVAAINKFPKTAIVSTRCQEWSNPENSNWQKASKRFDYCHDKKTFADYLYRMQKYVFTPTIYKTQNLRDHIFDMGYYSQFGEICYKPFVANTMKDDDTAIIFRSKKLLKYRTFVDRHSALPTYSAIIAYNKFFKDYMSDTLYSKFMYNLINYKQLKDAYFEGRDFTIDLNEFIHLAIKEDAGCTWTKLCTIPYLGFVFQEVASFLRNIFKTKYKRIFSLDS